MTVAAQPVALVAPDSFKGTFTAAEVGEALADGLRAGGAPVEVVVLPIADGGEGTLGVLAPALGARLCTARVSDPLGRTIDAAYALAPDRATAVVEVALAAGLGLVAAHERDPWAASTRGVGELIVAARDAGVGLGADTDTVEIVVGLGGSASTDGGAGALEAIAAGGGLGSARLVLLCDVATPFELAAEIFGPQKGADPGMVRRLTARLARQAAELGRDPRGVPMTGAAGGLAGGLWAELHATLVPGADYVLDRVGFGALLRRSVIVVTGEGRLDAQTGQGKAVSAVIGRATAAAVPVHAVVGSSALEPAQWRSLGLRSVREAGTRAELAAAGRELAGLIVAALSRRRSPC